MIIKYSNVEYHVADKYAHALRRAFTRAGAKGMGIGEATDFLRDRVAPWDRSPNVLILGGGVTDDRPLADSYTARQVVGTMLSRLLDKWIADGFLERKKRGTYASAASMVKIRRSIAECPTTGPGSRIRGQVKSKVRS